MNNRNKDVYKLENKRYIINNPPKKKKVKVNIKIQIF